MAAPGRGGGEERRAGGGEGRKTKAALGFFYTRDRLAWCLDEGRGWRLEAGGWPGEPGIGNGTERAANDYMSRVRSG